MIWIATLCMLAIAAWFFFNGLNEMRWVEAHQHDETVASDEGLLPSFTARTRSGLPEGDAKVSIEQENTRFAKAVKRVQEKTSGLGERFIEAKASAARLASTDGASSAREEDTFFGRSVARVSQRIDRMEEGLDRKIKAAASDVSPSASAQPVESFIERASKRVAKASDDISNRIALHQQGVAQNFKRMRQSDHEDGVFGQMVSRVSGTLDKIEQKAAAKRRAGVSASSSARGDAANGDLMSRVKAKVGDKINEVNQKMNRQSKGDGNAEEQPEQRPDNRQDP